MWIEYNLMWPFMPWIYLIFSKPHLHICNYIYLPKFACLIFYAYYMQIRLLLLEHSRHIHLLMWKFYLISGWQDNWQFYTYQRQTWTLCLNLVEHMCFPRFLVLLRNSAGLDKSWDSLCMFKYILVVFHLTWMSLDFHKDIEWIMFNVHLLHFIFLKNVFVLMTVILLHL